MCVFIEKNQIVCYQFGINYKLSLNFDVELNL